jgi:DNA-binding transcriptional LysR family regulator
VDRLEEWKVFVAVASKRSFADVARGLGRSPQAVTRAVAALEARLGARLLHRTTRSVSLTSAGQRHLERARRLLAEFDALERPDDKDAPLTGRLSVTAPVLFGQLHVAPVLYQFLHAHPTLDARLVLLDRVVSLAEEGLDLGVRLGALPDSSLLVRLIGHVRSVVCASPAYLRRAGEPRSPEALSKHACIAFGGTTPIADRWAFPTPAGRERTVGVRARLIVDTGQAAIDAALAGLGLVRVLSYQVEPLLAQRKLRVVLAAFEPPPMPVHVIQLPGVQSRIATAFADFAVERLRARLTPRRARRPR